MLSIYKPKGMIELMKRIIAAALAIMITAPQVFAADNFYDYNKFVYRVIKPETGVCDVNASFVGHEVEFADVNDYFKGLISVFGADLDGNGSDELITVESKSINVYTKIGKEVAFCDSYKRSLIGNSGNSYANVFVKNSDGVKYLGVETFFADNDQNGYQLEIFRLNPETLLLQSKAYVYQVKGNEEIYQSVSKDGVNVFTHTSGNGIASTVDPNGMGSAYMAAKDALWNVGITDEFLSRNDRFEYNADLYGKAHRLSDCVRDMQVMSYIVGTGVRNTPKPVVVFEDNSPMKDYFKEAYDIKVTVDGEEIDFKDQAPVIVKDRTLVPLRAIFEALGADVSWLPAAMKVVANTVDTNVTMTIGKNEYFVNGEKKTLDVSPMLMNGRTMIPARAAAESFGCSVDWDDASKTVIIKGKAN